MDGNGIYRQTAFLLRNLISIEGITVQNKFDDE